MANEVGRINRKIKATMKRLIDKEDDTAFQSIIELANKRAELLKTKKYKRKTDD